MRLLLPALALLSSCCSQTKNIEWKQETLSGTLTVPDGWRKIVPDGTSQSQRLFQKYGDHETSSPTISLNVYSRFDPRFPKTQEGCAQSYLDGIHDVHDDSVTFSKIGANLNPQFGQVTLYHYRSEWFGDHLVSFLVSSGAFIHVELWTKDREQMKADQFSFEEFVKGVRMAK